MSEPLLSAPALATGEPQELVDDAGVVTRWEWPAPASSGLTRPGVAPFVVTLVAVATIGNLVWHPSYGPVNWWLSIVCLLPLQSSVLHIVGAIRTRRLLAQGDDHVPRCQDRLIIAVPTVGRHDTLPACRRVVLSLIEECPAYFDDFRIDVIIEERAEAWCELHELARLDPVVRVVTIPAEYQTVNGSRFKARANQYALELRTAEGESTRRTWVLHMDDDTAVRADTVRAIAQFLSAHPEKHLAQGILCYPRQNSANHFTWLADSIRSGDDVGRFALLTGGGTPYAGLHGELLLIRASVEREIGWDFGPREVTEDARFALLFAGRYPGASGWFPGCSYGSSPETVADFCRQRARWAEGLFRLAFSRSIRLRDKVILGSGLGSCVVGLLQHPLVLLPVMYLAGVNTSPVIRLLVFVWAVNLSRLVWQYWQGLQMNSQASGWCAPRTVDRVAVVALIPLFALAEGAGIAVALGRLLTGRSAKFTVIAKGHAPGD